MGIEVIISQVDEELIQLKKLESKLTRLISLSPSVEFMEMCLDKNRLGLMLQHLNISDPKTQLLSNSSEFSGKEMLFKPQFGRGSRNIYVARNDLEFYCLKKYLLNQTEKFICQEYLNGKEYTVQMLSSSSGILNAIVPLAVHEKRGSTTHSNLSTNSSVIQECKRVHEAFKPGGTYNIQLIHSSDDNRAYVIEINPRVSTTMCVSLKLGFDPVEIYLDESQDSEIKIPSGPLILRRYWNNVYF
jgi:carbamoyl-phosphate synthase large subunit